MSVDCIIEDRRWAKAGILQIAFQAYDATLRKLGYNPERFEIGLLACNDDKIADLNAEFRGNPTPTNVLSWPSAERGAEDDGGKPLEVLQEMSGDIFLGDVAISYDTCLAEAQNADKSLKGHTLHLLIHGTLHLFGYDHERDADAELMERLETQILATLGQPDPYSQQSRQGGAHSG